MFWPGYSYRTITAGHADEIHLFQFGYTGG